MNVEALREVRSDADERAERDAKRLAALIVRASESEGRVAALEVRAAESQAQIAAQQAFVTRALESGALTDVDGR